MINWKDNTAPELPYYAMIFVSEKSDNLEGYSEMDDETLGSVLQKQNGYLGYESIRNEHKGIFISYWKSHDDIDAWRQYAMHVHSHENAPKGWYDFYHNLVCKVESSHIFKRKE